MFCKMSTTNSDISSALQLVRRTIIDSLELQNLVSGRVYTSHFIDYDNKTTPMPLVIIEVSGGRANYSMQSQRLIVNIYAYSEKSSAEAGTVYHKVYTALNAQPLSRGTLSIGGYMYELERPLTGFNEDVRGWFYRGTFVLHTAG